MMKQADMIGQIPAEVIDLAAKSAASMTAASMFGMSMMTQAAGLWMGSVARLMEQAQKPAAVSQSDSVVAPEAVVPATGVRRTSAGDRTHPRRKTAGARAVAQVGPDDLKRISGVGPKLQQVLNGLGIATYAQVAALEANDIASLEEKLGIEGRIGRDGWVEQASRLAAGH